jgi:hypothetical protein
MNRNCRTGLLVAGGFALLALPALAADLTIVSNVTMGKGAPETSTLYLTADRMRQSGSHDMIFELSTGRMVMIDHGKKEYWESTSAEREAFMARMDEQMRKMKEQMANLPASLREKMGAGMGVGAVTVRKEAETRKIAGYTCQKYTVTMGESMTMEQWATPDLQVPLQYYESMKAMFANNPMLKGLASSMEEFKKIKGFPLAETTSIKGPMGLGGVTTREAVEVKQTPIPASTFEVPAGYKKKESPFKGK